MRILDAEFNAVVSQMVNKFLPSGFDTTEQQTASFEDLQVEFNASGRIAVNTGFSENTIFGFPEINWQFRAWHDYCHLTGNFDFSQDGEQQAAKMQIEQLRENFAGHPKLELFCSLVDIEVNGQVLYFMKYNDFPANQIEFTLAELQNRGI